MIVNRAAAPIKGKERTFRLPEINKFRLSNGILVHLVERAKLPIIQVSILIHGGSKYDPKGKCGLSRLLSFLLDEGAGPYNAFELNQEIEMLGSSIDVHSDNDEISITLLSLKEHFDRTLTLAKYIFEQPHLLQNDFDREKKNLLTRLLQIKDNSEVVANKIFMRSIYGDANPYAFPVYGNKKSVENIGLSDVKGYYEKHLTPSNTEFVVVGCITQNELYDLLNEKFGSNDKKSKQQKIDINKVESKRKILLFDKSDSSQTEIIIGHLSGLRKEEDYFSKLILNKILGGQFNSRLNMNLREDKGFTYGINSNFKYFKEGAHFTVSTSVNIESTLEAICEIENELREIKNNLKEEEIEFAKTAMILEFPSRFETSYQTAMYLIGKIIHDLPDDYFNTYIESISKLTYQEIKDATIKHLNNENTVIVLVGDKEKITKLLADSDYSVCQQVDEEGNIISFS